MNVLFLINSDFGVQNTIGARSRPIAEEISNEKNNLTVICRGYEEGFEDRYDIKKIFPLSDFFMKALTAIPVYISKRFPSNKIKKYVFEYFSIRKLRKINLQDVDIVHSWDYLPKTYSHIKNKNPEIRIVQDVPIVLPNVLRDLENTGEIWREEELQTPDYVRDSFEYIDLFIAPSGIVKESLLEEGISKDKVEVIPFGVDVEKFQPVDKEYMGKFKVAFAGSLNRRKGIKYLVQAWKELNLENAELNLYGRIYPRVLPYLENSREYNIKTPGFVDVTEKLPENHIYSFPSLMEGSSKSVYEAMACGLPVITTYNSGPVLEDGKEGFIVPVQDVETLKEKIKFFYDNRKKIKEFGKRARKLAEEYTWKSYGKEVNKIYEEALR